MGKVSFLIGSEIGFKGVGLRLSADFGLVSLLLSVTRIDVTECSSNRLISTFSLNEISFFNGWVTILDSPLLRLLLLID